MNLDFIIYWIKYIVRNLAQENFTFVAPQEGQRLCGTVVKLRMSTIRIYLLDLHKVVHEEV
jgi:hypothetical protein